MRPLSNAKEVGRFSDLRGDDLLVVSESFEARCVGLSDRLMSAGAGYVASRLAVIRYGDKGNRRVRERVRRHAAALRHATQALCPEDARTDYELDGHAVLTANKVFSDLLKSVADGGSVTVDISTLTKLHVLYLTRAALREVPRLKRVIFAYTRARYNSRDSLTEGAAEPIVAPLFGSPRLGDGRSFLVLFAGLEPQRSFSVWRYYGQEGGLCVFVDSGPTDIDRCASRAKRMHRFLASEAAWADTTIPAFSPTSVVELLSATLAQCDAMGQHMFVAPLTTKWESAGVAEFFVRHPEAEGSVVYAAPGVYDVDAHHAQFRGDVMVSLVTEDGIADPLTLQM